MWMKFAYPIPQRNTLELDDYDLLGTQGQGNQQLAIDVMSENLSLSNSITLQWTYNVEQ